MRVGIIKRHTAVLREQHDEQTRRQQHRTGSSGGREHRREGKAACVLVAGVFVVTVSVGFVESLMARLAFRRVPLQLATAFLLCVFALLVAWKGGVA